MVIDNTYDQYFFGKIKAQDNLLILYNKNSFGLAGAYNAALKALPLSRGVEYVLFLDDDTEIQQNKIFSYISKLTTILRDNDVVASSGIYRDKNSGTRANYLKCGRFTYHRISDEATVEQVTFIINSMSIWKISFLEKMKGYREDFIIDHIDTDMCLKAQKNNKKILVDLTAEFNHAIGTRLSYNLFGKKYNSGNHSSLRRQIIGRSTMILMLENIFVCPVISYIMLQRIFYELLGIMMVENKKLPKAFAFIKGCLSGFLHFTVFKHFPNYKLI